MAKNPGAWSFSRLTDFEECPKKYQGKYITKEFPQPDFEAYHLKRGKLIHEALEQLLKTGNWDFIDPNKNANLWCDNKSVLKVPLDFLKPLIEAVFAAGELDVEDQKAFDANLNRVSWFDDSVWVRVIMDCMVLTSPEHAVILDWKSGSTFAKIDQLRLCAGAAFALHPELQEVFIAYIWTDHPDKEFLHATYTRRQHYEAIWQEFGDRAELIQLCIESGNWEAKPSARNCKFCPAMQTQCEHKVKYGT